MDKFSSIFLEPESKKLVYLTSNKIEDITQETLDKKFYKEEVSYIPVFKSIKGQHLGTFSRKKYFLLKLKRKRFNPFEILDDKIHVVDLNDNLFDVLKRLKDSSGLILKINGEHKKFISPRTVSNSFEHYTSKIILIESIEIKIREIIKKYKINFIDSLKILNQHHKNNNDELKGVDDLTFFDYNLIFNDNWDNLKFLNLVSKSDFLGNLNVVSQYRNDLFHFRNKLDFEEKPFKDLIKDLTY